MRMPRVVDIHKKNKKRPHYDVYIGRAVRNTEFTSNSKWANLNYPLGAYEEWIAYKLEHFPDRISLSELDGKILGCWCLNTTELKPLKCHGQVLMKLFKEKFINDIKMVSM